MLARRFLGCIFVLILLVVAAAVLYFQFAGRLLLDQATPKGHFEEPKAITGPDYFDPSNWVTRPGTEPDPSEWLPDGFAPSIEGPPSAAVFYVHPTTYLERDRWNAALQPGGSTEKRTLLFTRTQASAFNHVAEIWAPRYRQAAFGAFLLKSDDARRALDLAYEDVARAFDHFLSQVPPDRPLILAGHSQGALHLLRLLADRRSAISGRLAAAYVVGWPVGIAADLPATGLQPCRDPGQRGCVLSWQSFAEPANTELVTRAWVGTRGLTGATRTQADILCTDPIGGRIGGSSPPAANPGTLIPNAAFTSASLAAGQVGAECKDGFLIVRGKLPPLGGYALLPNNLHPFDFSLFWGAVRADSVRRLAAFEARP